MADYSDSVEFLRDPIPPRGWWWYYPTSFEMRARRNSEETKRLGHDPRSGPEMKIVPKMARRKGSDAEQSS